MTKALVLSFALLVIMMMLVGTNVASQSKGETDLDGAQQYYGGYRGGHGGYGGRSHYGHHGHRVHRNNGHGGFGGHGHGGHHGNSGGYESYY